MNIVLFGPPGAGKGTQAKLICEKYFLNHLSTGDLLRKESSKETSLGIQIKNTINDGKLVSNETTIELIKQFIDENKNNKKGFLFDGFPRNKKQAELLDHLMVSINEKILCVILLNVNEDVLKERIMNRSTTEGRSDDNLETLSKRLHTYSSETEPLIEYYSSQNLVRKVLGTGAISDINQGISSHIEASLNA
jgi:adenylate kinase|tara:strand:- start:1403 stop:1981 length:579 start_codon:yes stop_codon:yes gene_type:complete